MKLDSQSTLLILTTCSKLKATLTAIHAIARPLHTNKPISHEEMVTRDELMAKDALDEQKTYLVGSLTSVDSPFHYQAIWVWSGFKIQSIVDRGSSTATKLEQLLGQLVHVGMATPFIHHFLSCIKDLHHRDKH